ncbi:Protein ELYS [Acropora cervicornis]|uniref:Protein ELYS n=1 Tax=Acropora cervicornis TaxID=6130 RepID=A0AAD9Q1P0_ACRCE|nr:Protein ELYS [Acropora cervicornis]
MMNRAFSANSITPLRYYSSVTIECLERPDPQDDTESFISGSVLRGGKLAWLVRGATLEVVDTKTGSRQASWRFGSSLKQQRPVSISSLSELRTDDGVKLLVGLKDLTGAGGGIVCIFDPFLSRVIKAIEVPYPVTVVESVTGSGGAHASPHALSLQLKLLFGIAAVGTEQGHCYLIDLRLDDEAEEFDEWHMSPIDVVDSESHDMEQLRNAARRNGTHLAIEIGNFSHVFGRFSYVQCDSTEMKNMSSGEVFVTAVKYIRQTSILVIGFNFGCFQIYSSQVDRYYSAITHFTYQEPEDDPRYCCYLWVARGPIVPENSPETPATLTLYQLVFASRDHLPEQDGSSFYRPRVDDDVPEESDNFRDLTLAVCVWEAPAHDQHSRPTCYLGIFDVNCWYQSQMPASIRDAMFGSKDYSCPFFAFISLVDILDVASPDGIVDIYVDAATVSNFVSSVSSTLEQHLWPASLKFDTCCLMETGLVDAKFLGVQRQILANISKEGISCLSDAHEYFNVCYAAGLLPRNFDLSKPQDKTFHLEAVLSVALEHGLVTFIVSCVQKLGAGNVVHAGCSLKLMLDWAWDRVVEIKNQLDQLCVPLFDCGGGTPDDQMLLMLENQNTQLSSLTAIFQALLTQSATTTHQGLKDLEAKYNVVSILSMYLKVVLWFIGQGLLPEQPEGSTSAARSQGVSQWILKGGNEIYPPSSLHGLCSLYLIENVHPNWKHCIVFYLLLDLCFLETELQRNEVAAKFAGHFKIPEGLIRLVQGFWLLDHQYFEVAVTTLVDPLIKTELGEWQKSFIMKTLLFQGEFQKALYFMKVTQPAVQGVSDVKLFLSVLLANGKVAEAFSFQRKHQNPKANKDILYHFFNAGNMSKLLQHSLDSTEERGRYVEGIRLNEVLKKDKLSQQDERAKVRSALVDAHVRCLPRVQRKLLFGPDKPAHQATALTEVARPKPLSTVVRKVDKGRPLSRAVLLSSAMDKVHEIRMQSEIEAQQSRPTEKRECQEPEPFVSTPVTPRAKCRLTDSSKVGVVYPSSPISEKVSPTRKVTSPTFLDKRSRRQFFSGAEALSLLATPPILKVKPITPGLSINNTEAVNISTPQSILKITRVIRRTSPQPSPKSSPPTTRRGSSEQLSRPETSAHNDTSEFATPSRRISPPKQTDAVLTPDTGPSHVSNERDVIGIGTKTMAVEDTESQQDDQMESATDGVDEQEETEVQITAAVMDITGDSDDLEEEAAGTHDDDYSSYELDDSDTAAMDADSENESVKESPQITSVTVEQTEEHVFAKLSPVAEQPSFAEEPPSPRRVSDEPSTLPPPLKESQPDSEELSPPSCSGSRSPQKLSQSAEIFSSELVQSRTPPQLGPNQETLETADLSYVFSPPAVLQTPPRGATTPLAVAESSTPSLEFIFSPPLTRSMARRRSSGITPGSQSFIREFSGKATPHQSPSNSPISFVSPVPHPESSPRGSRKRGVRLPAHSMTLRARKCPARPTRSAKLPHTKL